LSLRQQYVLVFVAFSILVSVWGGGLAYQNASLALEDELDRRLVQVAGAAADVGFSANDLLSFQEGMEEDEFYQAERERLSRLAGRLAAEAYIIRQDLRAIVTTASTDSIRIDDTLFEFRPHQRDIDEAVQFGSAASERFEPPSGGFFKYGFVALEHSFVPEPANNVVLAVRMSADFTAPLDEFRRKAIVGSFLAAVVAALIAWFMATTITRPLNRLGRVALRIQRGRMDEPVRQERGGELNRLSRAMERMRVGILHRDEQLRLMLAQVAHEIRNPLGGLELFASAAAESEDPAERSRFIGKVRDEINALNLIIDDFLAFAKPLQPSSELHDIRRPVGEAVELVGMEMTDAGGELHLEMPEHPVMGKADPEHVKRVTLNLARNAAQAGQWVEVRVEPYRGEAVLFVRDDGPGIPPGLEDRIFEPFVTDKEQGAGLGLAIVKRVVEANGGRVELTTGPLASGVGAEFRVYFRGGEDFLPNGTEN
jgi:signal transduction histidine kinase